MLLTEPEAAQVRDLPMALKEGMKKLCSGPLVQVGAKFPFRCSPVSPWPFNHRHGKHSTVIDSNLNDVAFFCIHPKHNTHSISRDLPVTLGVVGPRIWRTWRGLRPLLGCERHAWWSNREQQHVRPLTTQTTPQLYIANWITFKSSLIRLPHQ